jgi:hypothetical protein
MSLVTTSVGVSCKNLNNGSAFVAVHGALAPNTYTWNTVPPQTNDTATGLAMGSYNVLVTDSFGCSVSATVSVDSNYNQVSTTITIGNCDSALFPIQKCLIPAFLHGPLELWVLRLPTEQCPAPNADFGGSSLG